MAISLNPGFVLLLAALVTLAAPQSLRLAIALAATIAAGALALAPDFGAHDMFRQVGLMVVPLRLDAASQVFGLALTGAVLVLALAASHRRRPLEDAAMLAHAGGALTAIYGGDLVTFVAGAEVSILASCALVAMGDGAGARGAARRLLIWHALAGALLVVGAGLVWAQTGDVRVDRIDATTPAGLCLLLALLVRVGAPGAHVWVKDAAPRATAFGFAALGPFTASLAIYGLLRMFPGEPALAPIGAVMTIWGLVAAAAERRPRVVLAYGWLASYGLLVMSLGIGAPLVVAGVAANAFGLVFVVLASALTIGWATGAAPAFAEPPWRIAPITTIAALLTAAAALAAPGFATYASAALLQDALARQAPEWMFFVFVLASAGAIFAAGAKAPMLAFFQSASPGPPPFATQLAILIALVMLIGVGVAPGWLFALLPPSPIAFIAYDWDHLAARFELVCAAGLVLAVLMAPMARRVLPPTGPIRDVDSLYRGAGARAVQRLWLALMHGYSAFERGAGRGLATMIRAAHPLARRLDAPAQSSRFALVWAIGAISALAAFCLLAVG